MKAVKHSRKRSHGSKTKARGKAERPAWMWDTLAILIAASLGLGPYALLSVFGSLSPKQVVYQVQPEIQGVRGLAGNP